MGSYRVTFLLLLFLNGVIGFGQDFTLKEIKGLPTREIYNLLTDSKGFLWIAHNLGLSRFDGNTFTHFKNSQANSLSIFDLVEDPQGTIWCHDISGQLFYVKNGQMRVLKEFAFADEIRFQRMVLWGHYLLTSSRKGMFVCDTRTLKTRYIGLPDHEYVNAHSLCVIGGKVLLAGEEFYTYDFQKPTNFLQKTTIKNFNYPSEKNSIQPEVYKDTGFIINQKEGLLYKIAVNNNDFVVTEKIIMDEFINTLSVVKNKLFINTKNYTKALHDTTRLAGYNISDIEMDKEGNTWVSSVEKGLYVNYRQQWRKLPVIHLLKNESVNRLTQTKKYFIYGLKKSQLVFEDKENPGKSFSIDIPQEMGSIEYLKVFDENQLFVGCSSGLYHVNITTRAVEKLPIGIGVKEMVPIKDGFLIAGASGLMKLIKSTGSPGGYKVEQVGTKRVRSIYFDSTSGILTAAFQDGVFNQKNNKWHPAYFQGNHIFASYVNSFNGRIYIGTFNNGLLICSNDDTTVLSLENGLKTKTILRGRNFKEHLWLIGSDYVQVVDLLEEKICRHIDVPILTNQQVNDIDERDSIVVIATTDGLFYSPIIPPLPLEHKSFLLHVKVNGRDTIGENLVFPFNSSVQLSVSIPLFSDPAKISYKYRLLGDNTGDWNYLEAGENIFNFPLLSPGYYNLEIMALHPDFPKDGFGIAYSFTISPPWYATWWFKLSLAIFISILLFGLYKYRIHQLLRVQAFRRKVSSNLHDDIGSTLSSINIYSELAKKEKNNLKYLETIQQHTQSVIANLDDLVWLIDPKHDSVDTLIERMRSFGSPLLDAKKITLEFKINNDGSLSRITADQRTNLYLAFKEMINNLVKHANATKCNVLITIIQKRFTIKVIDNGVGFDISITGRHRNGLMNLKTRAGENNGEFVIVSEPLQGTTAMFTLK